MAASRLEPAATCSEETGSPIMCSKSLLVIVKTGPLFLAAYTVFSQPTDASLPQAIVSYCAAASVSMLAGRRKAALIGVAVLLIPFLL
jgi:hypothetical protein